MEASTALGAAIAGPFEAPVLARLGRLLAVSVLSMLVVTGLFVVGRRVAGALSQPLSPAALATVGLALAGSAVLFRRAFSPMRLARPAAYALWAAPSVALVIWAAAISLAGSDALGLVALFGALLLEEGYSWGRRPARFSFTPRRGATSAELHEPPAVIPPPGASGELATLEADRDEAVTQHMIRRQHDAGETIEGWLRVDFVTAQRHATAHLAICPPLERAPECFAEQIDGPPARIKVAQVLAYGVRFEIRLDQPAAASGGVCLEFSIQARQADSLEERN